MITRGDKPMVRLVPVVSVAERRFGSMRGKAGTTPEFFDSLPEEELKAWGV